MKQLTLALLLLSTIISCEPEEEEEIVSNGNEIRPVQLSLNPILV